MPWTHSVGLLNMSNTAYSLVKDWSTPMPPVAQFFNILLLVAVVGALAYFTTRLLGVAKFGRSGRKNLEIIETIGVGPQSFVHILRVGEQYVMVGVTKGQVSMLTEVDASKLKLPEPGTIAGQANFETLFSKFKKDEKEHGRFEKSDSGGDHIHPRDGKDNNP